MVTNTEIDIERLSEKLFNGSNQILNFKLFPGSMREVDSSDVIKELYNSLAELNLQQVEE